MEVCKVTKTIVKVGLASCGVAAGAVPIYETLLSALKGHDDVEIKKVGCIGLCYMEPIVEIERDGKSIAYGKVDTELAKEIAESHALRGEIVQRAVILDPSSKACEMSRMDSQVRIVLRTAVSSIRKKSMNISCTTVTMLSESTLHNTRASD